MLPYPVQHGTFTTYGSSGNVIQKGLYEHRLRKGQWMGNNDQGSGNYVKGKRAGTRVKRNDDKALNCF